MADHADVAPGRSRALGSLRSGIERSPRLTHHKPLRPILGLAVQAGEPMTAIGETRTTRRSIRPLCGPSGLPARSSF